MKLTSNRRSKAAVVVLLVVTLLLLAGSFAVGVQPAAAGTCGTYTIYSYNCRQSCWDYDYGCGGEVRIKCFMDYVLHLGNPISDRMMYPNGANYYCTSVQPNCPGYCVP